MKFWNRSSLMVRHERWLVFCRFAPSCPIVPRGKENIKVSKKNIMLISSDLRTYPQWKDDCPRNNWTLWNLHGKQNKAAAHWQHYKSISFVFYSVSHEEGRTRRWGAVRLPHFQPLVVMLHWQCSFVCCTVSFFPPSKTPDYANHVQ